MGTDNTSSGKANEQAAISSLQLKDGTELRRIGPEKWVANPEHPRRAEWMGDIVIKNGQPRFIYKYEKALSQSNLELRLQDGSRLALREDDGSLVLPGSLNTLSPHTPEENALNSILGLGYDIFEAKKRIRLLDVSSGNGVVNCNFVIVLSSSEGSAIKRAIEGSKRFCIVEVSEKLYPRTYKEFAVGGEAISEQNVPGYFEYDSPRPDHTATTAILFVDKKSKRLKVVTGTRGNEPFKGKQALLGGFVNVSASSIEDVRKSAEREIMEETSGAAERFQLLRVSDARKDPRNQVIDSQFVAQITEEDFEKFSASDDVEQLHGRFVSELLCSPEELAFDHYDALKAALEACKGRLDLKEAAFFTKRDLEFAKAIAEEEENAVKIAKSDEERSFYGATIAALKLMRDRYGATKKEIEEAILTQLPQFKHSDLDYARAKAMQIQYEKIDYVLSKAGWSADPAMMAKSNKDAGNNLSGAGVLLDQPSLSPGQTRNDDNLEAPEDVVDAIYIALSFEDISNQDRDTIKSLETVLKNDKHQKLLLENGYKRVLKNSKSTKPSEIITFFLSYCGRKPEEL